jgi:hypothetical protein
MLPIAQEPLLAALRSPGTEHTAFMLPDANPEVQPPRMALMVERYVFSSYVTTGAVPFDGKPPRVTIQSWIQVECCDIRVIERYLCDGWRCFQGCASQFQLIVWRNVNHVSLHEMFWMNEHPSSVGIEASVASGVPAGIQPVKVWFG